MSERNQLTQEQLAEVRRRCEVAAAQLMRDPRTSGAGRAVLDLLDSVNFTYCAYCGQEYPRDADAKLITAHVMSCPDHPMTAMRLYNEQARSHLRGIVDHWYEFSDQPGCAGLDERMSHAHDFLYRGETDERGRPC